MYLDKNSGFIPLKRKSGQDLGSFVGEIEGILGFDFLEDFASSDNFCREYEVPGGGKLVANYTPSFFLTSGGGIYLDAYLFCDGIHENVFNGVVEMVCQNGFCDELVSLR